MEGSNRDSQPPATLSFTDHLEACALEKEVGLQFLKYCFQNESSLKAKISFWKLAYPLTKARVSRKPQGLPAILKLRRVLRVPLFFKGMESGLRAPP